MLDDRERAMLLDIENHLLAEDPGWSTAFSTYAWRARRQRTFELAFHAVASVVFAALALLMVVAQAPGPAVFFGAVAALMVWLLRRLRRTPVLTGPGAAGAPPSPPERT
jgi:predicted membrane metal-binding protein